jgi:hypothetical protein
MIVCHAVSIRNYDVLGSVSPIISDKLHGHKHALDEKVRLRAIKPYLFNGNSAISQLTLCNHDLKNSIANIIASKGPVCYEWVLIYNILIPVLSV